MSDIDPMLLQVYCVVHVFKTRADMSLYIVQYCACVGQCATMEDAVRQLQVQQLPSYGPVGSCVAWA